MHRGDLQVHLFSTTITYNASICGDQPGPVGGDHHTDSPAAQGEREDPNKPTGLYVSKNWLQEAKHYDRNALIITVRVCVGDLRLSTARGRALLLALLLLPLLGAELALLVFARQAT